MRRDAGQERVRQGGGAGISLLVRREPMNHLVFTAKLAMEFRMEDPHDYSVANSPLPGWSTVAQTNPGWLYMILNEGLIKVGKTTAPSDRLREARTWLPYGTIIGVKPFWRIHLSERTLHCGLANCWEKGEWHLIPSEFMETLTDGFRRFHDHDRNRNSLDFNYWIGGSGMGEMVVEQNYRKTSLRRWQRYASLSEP